MSNKKLDIEYWKERAERSDNEAFEARVREEKAEAEARAWQRAAHAAEAARKEAEAEAAALLKTQAVCHCGQLEKDHDYVDGHGPVEMPSGPCPDPYRLEALERAEKVEADLACRDATLAMAVARLGGLVGGHPTHRGNFLQRVDELREAEAERDKLAAQVANTESRISAIWNSSHAQEELCQSGEAKQFYRGKIEACESMRTTIKPQGGEGE